MKKRVLFSDELIKELIKLGCLIVVYKLYNKVLYPDSNIFQVTADSLVIIAVSFIYFILFFISGILQRPVKIKLNMFHSLSGEDHHKVFHYDGPIREDTKKIKISLCIPNTSSVWNFIALKLIKNSSIEILIEIDPENDAIICQPTVNSNNDIVYMDNFFKIDIKKLINSTLNKKLPMYKEYEFLVDENRDNTIAGNQKFCIKPLLLINSKAPRFLHNIFVKFINEMPTGFYIIEFYK